MSAPATTQIRDAWDAISARFDEHTMPATLGIGGDVVGRLDIAPGTRFLDVAAGSGALSLPAARLGAEVLGTDIAPGMVERLEARARAEGLRHVEARVMDGCALDLDDDSFDVAASLNGVSLFPDLVGGLRQMRRVVRPGGQVALAAFGPPPTAEWLGYFVAACKAVVPDFVGLPTNPPPLPFQVSDPVVMARRLTEAGLDDVRVDTLTEEIEFTSGAHHWNVVTSSNPIGDMMVSGFTDQQRTEVIDVLDGMLRDRAGGSLPATLTTAINIGLGTVT